MDKPPSSLPKKPGRKKAIQKEEKEVKGKLQQEDRAKKALKNKKNEEEKGNLELD